MLVIGPHRQAPIYVQAVGADSISTRNIRATTGASGDAAPYTQPYGACRGEHCSPLRSLYRGFRREESCPLQGTLPLLQLCAAANFPLKPPHFTQTLQNLYASLLVKYPLTKL